MPNYGEKIWMNGEFVNTDEATVHVMSHAIHYASSVFEGIKSYYTDEGKQIIFRLDEHIDRLFKSASLYEMTMPYSKAEVKQAIIDLVDLNRGKDLYIRPCFFMGLGYETIEITDAMSRHLIIAVWSLPRATDKEYHLGLSSFIRPSENVLLMESKCSANYMNSTLIKQEAKRNGYSDAIALNSRGYVAEASTANVFFIKDNTLFTPSKDSSILNGITRQSVIEMCEYLNINIEEGDYTKEQLLAAETVFVTGTAAEMKIVTKVLDKQYSSHELYEKLRSFFWDIINLKVEDFSKWITHV